MRKVIALGLLAGLALATLFVIPAGAKPAGVNGQIVPRWNVAGGYAYQDAYVRTETAAAAAGAQVAQVPHHTLSLWNNYQVHPRVGAALGVLYRTDMFAGIDNTVILPGYTRVGAAAFGRLQGSCACSSTSRICSTRPTTSTPTAIRTSLPGSRGRSGLH